MENPEKGRRKSGFPLKNMKHNSFKKGLVDGLPIGIGYLSVSFAFGIFAIANGLAIPETLLISMTNVTSAGQLAAVPIIAGGGLLSELVVSQIIINLRYALMSVSLSQKLGPSVRLFDRFLISFVNTDEVFAVASAQSGAVGRGYMYGLITTPYLGWSLGTLLGAVAGDILPEIITAAKSENDTPYYTNSSHLPVGYTDDIFEALAVQDDLQTLYTSGTVFHAFLGEKLPDWKAAAALVRKIAENFKLPYYTMSPTYSICHEHGYLVGEQKTCPHCGAATEIWSRITGYYRPVQNWNDGKVQEYEHRKEYEVATSVLDGRALKDREPDSCYVAAAEAHAEAIRDAVNEVLLFTTTTCPNCRIAKNELEKAGVDYTVMDVAEHLDLVSQYGIQQAPTLIVRHGDQVEKLVGAGPIKKFAANQ